ncbi:hypothetical protein [Paenibacillus allorhizoplanae]|uniref:hypothetical protein n=1 Tax=Paenibacillus allorhizoplanae TaxID=2905648 RepID=UPI003B847C4D
MKEVSVWLQLKRDACGKVLRKLESKGLVLPIGGGLARSHKFMFTEKAVALLHGKN